MLMHMGKIVRLLRNLHNELSQLHYQNTNYSPYHFQQESLTSVLFSTCVYYILTFVTAEYKFQEGKSCFPSIPRYITEVSLYAVHKCVQMDRFRMGRVQSIRKYGCSTIQTFRVGLEQKNKNLKRAIQLFIFHLYIQCHSPKKGPEPESRVLLS